VAQFNRLPQLPPISSVKADPVPSKSLVAAGLTAVRGNGLYITSKHVIIGLTEKVLYIR